MMTASLRHLATGGRMTVNRAGGMRLLVIQTCPRSTTTVDGADDVDLRQTGDDSGATSGRCPFKLPVNTAASSPSPSPASASPSGTDFIRPMHELDGPIGWPVVGNFLTYLKKENRGKMHEVQVSSSNLQFKSNQIKSFFLFKKMQNNTI